MDKRGLALHCFCIPAAVLNSTFLINIQAIAFWQFVDLGYIFILVYCDIYGVDIQDGHSSLKVLEFNSSAI